MGTLLQLGSAWVDLDTGALAAGGHVRPAELRLLRYLADRPEVPVSVDELLTEVWGYHPRVASRAVYTSINRLRAAIEPSPAAPVHLVSAGRGYALRGAVRAASGAPPRPGRVPEPPSALFGRDALVSQLARTVPRLRTLLGPGGVGKTRVALEVARRQGLAGGAWWVDLGAARTADDAARRVAETVGLPIGAFDELGPCLVVLDGAEDVAGLAELLNRWHAATPTLHLLATSRTQLGVTHEQRVVVEPLRDDDACALLADRAGDDAVASVPADGLRALLAATAGLPLALEIAAAHLAQLGFAPILAQLTHLTAGTDPRRRTIDGVVRWSVDRLEPPDRAALAAVAAMDGSIPAEAAVVAIGGDALPRLRTLVDAGLVAVEHHADGPRFRALAGARAIVTPDRSALERVLQWIEDRAEAAMADPWSAQTRGGSSLGFAPEAQAQLLGLAPACGGESGARRVLGLVLSDGRRTRAGVTAVERALRDPLSPTTRFHLARWSIATRTSLTPADLRALAAIAEETGDPSLRVLAAVLAPAELDAAELDAAELLVDALPPADVEAARLHLAAGRFRAAAGRGDLAEAGTQAHHALRAALAVGAHPDDAAIGRGVAMEHAFLLGDTDEARRQAVAILALRPMSPARVADAHTGLVFVAFHANEPAVALDHAHRAVEASRETGGHYLPRLRNLAWLLFQLGCDDGRRWLGDCLDLERPDGPGVAWRALFRSALAAEARGPEAGLADAERALALTRQDRSPVEVPSRLWNAELALGVGDVRWAAELLAVDADAPPFAQLHVARAELLLWLGSRDEAHALAERARAVPGLPMTHARALAVSAVVRAAQGDFAGADRHLSRAAGVDGYGGWWLRMHRELVEAWRDGRPPRALPGDPEIPRVRFGADWARAHLATHDWTPIRAR